MGFERYYWPSERNRQKREMLREPLPCNENEQTKAQLRPDLTKRARHTSDWRYSGSGEMNKATYAS